MADAAAEKLVLTDTQDLPYVNVHWQEEAGVAEADLIMPALTKSSYVLLAAL